MDTHFPNLRHLRACLEVARSGSVNAASKQIHLSQPAISQAIAKLETTLSTKLFHRRPNGLFPTQSGRLYFFRAHRALDLIKQGALHAARAGSEKNKPVSTDFYRNLTATQLRALIASSRSNNFTIAARNSGISQPSLHRAARDIEKLSGLVLFEAHHRGILLSKPARLLVRYVMLAASELRHAYQEIHQESADTTQRIYVGSLPLARSVILPEAIGRLNKENNNTQIHIVDGPYDEQLKKLRHGELDFIIGALRQTEMAGDVVQETLFVDSLAVVARRNHPLIGHSNIKAGKLSEYSWIAPSRDTPTGQYLFKKLGIGDMNLTPVKVVSSSFRLVRALLLNSDYLTIISTHQVEKDIVGGILASLSVDMEDSKREIGLTYREDWLPTSAQKNFLNIIRSTIPPH